MLGGFRSGPEPEALIAPCSSFHFILLTFSLAGSRLQRRFRLEDTLGGLVAYLRQQDLISSSSRLMRTTPRVNLLDNPLTSTLGDLGISQEAIRIEKD